MFLLFASNSVWADDYNGSFDMELDEILSVDHYDVDPWKGYFNVTITNLGIDPWGDFHFSIPENYSAFFSTAMEPPTMTINSQVIDYEWAIVNNDHNLDFYFYSNPVYQDDQINFNIYTDNTQAKQFFSVSMQPSPVPVTGALILLSSGLIGIIGLKRKIKK